MGGQQAPKPQFFRGILNHTLKLERFLTMICYNLEEKLSSIIHLEK